MMVEKRKLLKCRYDRSIPVIRTYYEVTYLCKRCGETVVRHEYRDMSNERNDVNGKL